MTGRPIVVLTGASSGIGAAAAGLLCERGFRVAVVGRDPARTAAVASAVGGDPWSCDFAALDDVRRLARELTDAYPSIDVLANNAGGLFPKRPLSADGHSRTFQVDFLAPYLLTRLLREPLVRARGSVLMTGSSAAALGRLDPARLDRRGGFLAYADAKLALEVVTRDLARRWAADGVRAASLHPGWVYTRYGRDLWLFRMGWRLPFARLVKTPEQGADTLVWLACADGWRSGAYYVDRTEHPLPRRAGAVSAEALWTAAATLTGLD